MAAARGKRKTGRGGKGGGKRLATSFAAPREAGSLIVWGESGRVYVISPDELAKYDRTKHFSGPGGQAFLKELPNLHLIRKALIIRLFVTYDGV